MDLATLGVKVDARGAVAQLNELDRALGKTAASGSQVEKAATGVTSAFRALGAGVAAYGIGRLASQLGQMADTATLLRARLSLVTTGTANLARVQSELFTVAQRTRSGLEETATLYTRVARNADALGRSQADLLKFTELVQMQLQLSGASASEASAGVLQLSQALAKGKLDGDEFRTVLEAMPTVADALQASLGVTRGELFKLSEQGRISSRAIVDAVLGIERETKAKFEALPLTIGQAFTQARNQILRDIGAIDSALGASSRIARVIAALPNLAGRAGAAVLTGNNQAGRYLGGLLGIGGSASGPLNGAPGQGVVADHAAIIASMRSQFSTGSQAEFMRRKEWEDSRERARERERWEEQEIRRLERLAQARKRAALAAGDISGLPGFSSQFAGNTSFGMQTIGGMLPAGFDPRRGVTSTGGLRSTLALGGSDSRTIFDNATTQGDLFAQNLQRSIADGIARGFTEGLGSARGFFETVRGLGASVLGNAISSRITSGLTEKLTGLSGAALGGLGGGLLVVGGLVDSFFRAGEAAKRLAANMKVSADNIRSFADRATDGTLTPQQQEVKRLQDERDALARQAIAAANSGNVRISGLTGNVDGDIGRLRELLSGLGANALTNPIRRVASDLLNQLLGLQAATAENIAAAQRASFGATADSLKAFGGGLSLSQFSPLSPTAQLRDARAQYQALLARALGGDQDAAAQFQGSAQTLLGLSRNVNASGGRFVADFNTVQADTARLEALFRDRATVAEETRDAGQETAANTGRTNEIAADGFGGTIEALDGILVEMRELVRLQREGIA